MPARFSTLIASDPDHEKVYAEIYCKEKCDRSSPWPRPEGARSVARWIHPLETVPLVPLTTFIPARRAYDRVASEAIGV
jgi:hypothetical protein